MVDKPTSEFLSKFTNYGFDDNIRTFQDFYANSKLDYEENLCFLQDNLDSDSFVTAEGFLNLMLQLPLPSTNYLVKKEVIYQADSAQYKEEKTFLKGINQYYDLYNLVGHEKLDISVFKYHCGLKEFKDKVYKDIKDTIFIDGGGFWGDSALVFNKYNPSRILVFEPNKVNCAQLNKTIANNKLEHVILPYQLGLADICEQREMNYISNMQNYGASFMFSPYKAKKEQVNLVSIDSFLENNKELVQDRRIGFIKLDVEGYGLKAIQGAEYTICKNRPVISCSIYHCPEEFFGVIKTLKKYHPEYKFFVRALSQKFILKELTLFCF